MFSPLELLIIGCIVGFFILLAVGYQQTKASPQMDLHEKLKNLTKDPEAMAREIELGQERKSALVILPTHAETSTQTCYYNPPCKSLGFLANTPAPEGDRGWPRYRSHGAQDFVPALAVGLRKCLGPHPLANAEC